MMTKRRLSVELRGRVMPAINLTVTATGRWMTADAGIDADENVAWQLV